MSMKQTANVMIEANKGAAQDSAKLVAGSIINARLTKLVKPKLPMMVKGYADTPIGEAVIANAVAAALVHFLPTNQKVMLAADAMVSAAMLDFAKSFDLDSMIDEMLDGVKIPGLSEKE